MSINIKLETSGKIDYMRFMNNPFHQAFGATEVSETPVASPDSTASQIVYLADSAAKRIKQLQQEESNAELKLRVSVLGGGCSGFQYLFALDDKQNENDRIFSFAGASLICDETSLPYVNGSTIEYEETLAGSAFKIKNPNAESSCGCGVSFAPTAQ